MSLYLKIQKFLINFIPSKNIRHFVRKCLYDELFMKKYKLENNNNKFNSNNFKKHIIKNPSVLIIEPNTYHGEILPGFVKYFYDLNFNVDCLLRVEYKFDDPFILCDKKPNIYYGTIKYFKKILNDSKINNYDWIFISTSALWDEPLYNDCFLSFIKINKKLLKKIIIVEHNIKPYLKEYNEEKFLKNNKLFTLLGFNETQMLNPNYFGNVKITQKNEKTNFIVVGNIDNNCKNFDLLISAVKNLVDNGVKNFKITIIGKGNELIIKNEYKNYIDLKGRLTFKDMYHEMEKADFFLPLLDSSNKFHKKYLSGTTTGSFQLILGFLKPCLIESLFAKVYDFDLENALIYEKNKLSKVMQQAINITKNEYSLYQNNLLMKRNKIYEKSIKNLKNSLHYKETFYAKK